MAEQDDDDETSRRTASPAGDISTICLGAVQPGQEAQDEDCREHRDDTGELVRDRTQDTGMAGEYHSGTMCAGVTPGLAGM